MGDLVQNSTLYHNYTVNVTGPTATPGPPTWTPTHTPAAGNPTPTPGGNGQCSMTFNDVPNNNEFYTYIRDLYCHNPRVITGFDGNVFRPYEVTKRAQMAKMIVLAFAIPINTSGGPHFSDVPSSIEAYQYVETAYNRHIITGFNGGVFQPWAEVKRGQVAKMVVLGAGLQINTSGGPHFSDVPTGNESYQYIETAYNRRMITGFEGGVFKPYDNAKRGQIAKIVDGAGLH